jgi:hypothetical protein
MNMNLKISRIKELIDRLENSQTVTNRSLERVLTAEQIKALEDEWAEEKASRKVVKPKAIVKYGGLVRTAILLNGRMERMCHLKSPHHKIKEMAHKADSAFEQAIEFITEAIQNDRQLRAWIDRDVSEATCDPIGIPRVIGSSSFECQNKSKYPFLALTKRHLKLGALNSALDELQASPFESEEKVDVFRKRPQKTHNFEEFRF